jgi:hypothetical protein
MPLPSGAPNDRAAAVPLDPQVLDGLMRKKRFGPSVVDRVEGRMNRRKYDADLTHFRHLDQN